MRSYSGLTLTALASIALVTACGGGSVPVAAVPAVGTPGGAGSPFEGNSQESNPNYLYVVDEEGSQSFVKILTNNRRHREAGFITIALPPLDAFVDRQGNLYVANGRYISGPATVTEYAPGQWSGPSFTYSYDMNAPSAVTADIHGNVYEADSNDLINEYYQGVNTGTVWTCSTAPYDSPFAVAVDRNNDVFVALWNSGAGTIDFWEYVGGLGPRCAATTLPVSGLPFGGGGKLALDKNSNLLFADPYPGKSEVAVIDAPNYSSVNGVIGSGFNCAYDVSLNAKNTVAYVADPCNDTLTLVSYPSGTNLGVLGTGNGLSYPTAAVASHNAVY